MGRHQLLLSTVLTRHYAESIEHVGVVVDQRRRHSSLHGVVDLNETGFLARVETKHRCFASVDDNELYPSAEALERDVEHSSPTSLIRFCFPYAPINTSVGTIFGFAELRTHRWLQVVPAAQNGETDFHNMFIALTDVTR